MIRNSIIKLVSISLIIGLNWAGISAIGGTLASFSDEETSLENSLSAGTLDISLDPAGVYISGLMYPTDTTATSIVLSSSGSLATQYTSKTSLLTPDNGACNYVNLDAADGTQSYTGPLLNFISATTTITNPANWNYTFTIDPATPPSVWNKTCYFKWIFTAWSKDVVEPTGGFVDVEEKSGGIRIGRAIALNEILADPVGLDNAPKPNGEWVELYNNSNISFNLSGWYIYDSYDAHELKIYAGNTDTGNTIIPAHGFLVVYRDGDGDFTINNKDETIRLYTGYPVSSSVLVDSYSYTMEKPEGFSYARIPDGVGAWVDPIPTPGRMNVLEGEIIEVPAATPETIEVTEETIVEPVVETEISVSGAGLTGEVFVETIGDEVGEEVVEEVVEEASTETIAEEVPVEPAIEPAEEIIPEIVPEVVPEEQPAVIEETPIEEPVIEEIPPAIEENPVAIEQAPAQEEPPPPPPPPTPSEDQNNNSNENENI